jgi:voltage-gated potassium channel Kch
MKRFASLYLFAMVCIWPVVAFAADADADVGKVVVQHPVVSILAVLLPILQRVLREDVTGLPSLPTAWRLLVLAGFSLLSAVIDQLQHNWNVTAAIVAALVTAGPAFFVEVLHMIFGKRAAALIKADNAAKVAGALVLLVACALPVQGCNPSVARVVVPAADLITADAAQVSNIISAIDAAIHVFFALKPNPELEAKVLRAESDARLALDGVQSVASGAKDLAEVQSTPAFDKFEKAYNDFTAVVRDAGIIAGTKSVAPGSHPQLAGYPEPRLLKRAK